MYKLSNLWRETNEEKRYVERSQNDSYNDIRRAAEVHRRVRQYVMSKIKPGMSMIEICEMVENGTRVMVEESGLEAGKNNRKVLLGSEKDIIFIFVFEIITNLSLPPHLAPPPPPSSSSSKASLSLRAAPSTTLLLTTPQTVEIKLSLVNPMS